MLEMLTERREHSFVIYSELKFRHYESPYQEFDYCYLRLDADSFSVELSGRYDELMK